MAEHLTVDQVVKHGAYSLAAKLPTVDRTSPVRIRLGTPNSGPGKVRFGYIKKL